MFPSAMQMSRLMSRAGDSAILHQCFSSVFPFFTLSLFPLNSLPSSFFNIQLLSTPHACESRQKHNLSPRVSSFFSFPKPKPSSFILDLDRLHGDWKQPTPKLQESRSPERVVGQTCHPPPLAPPLLPWRLDANCVSTGGADTLTSIRFAGASRANDYHKPLHDQL